jgi:hypothetical protein
MIAADHPSDVDAVLGRLLRGSENHLVAYQRAAEGTHGTSGTRPRGGQARAGAGMMNRGAGHDGDCPMVDIDD